MQTSVGEAREICFNVPGNAPIAVRANQCKKDFLSIRQGKANVHVSTVGDDKSKYLVDSLLRARRFLISHLNE